VRAYLERRQIKRSTAVKFGMGASPDSWDTLLTEMTRRGYSKRELLDAGLVVQNKNGRLYDKFRNRLMLPVVAPGATWWPSAAGCWTSPSPST
jgi:DNA primase